MRAVLIANRGEIAVRIVRACRDAGIRSIACYADPDAGAPHTRLADEARRLPGTRRPRPTSTPPRCSRWRGAAGADAVHPGYGFLSEDAAFAEAVIAAGLTWIGPPPAAMRALGDKVSARAVARHAGAPLVAGTDRPVESVREVEDFAERHGFPLAIKAAFGGGGRGIRIVHDAGEIAEHFASAGREAALAFGRGECFVERWLPRARHVEAQVLADRHGTVAVVGTRDCSLQRRHQKLVEEAPAPFLGDEQRRAIHASAAAICAEVGYESAGTVEYLVGEDGTVSFLEVNARLQVEHPVTEETTGLDLVAAQLRIAAGEPLDLPAEPAVRGHAIEFRITCEDPARNFMPAPGTVTVLELPGGPGVRVDSGIEAGSVVGARFDSLLAKLIVTGRDRDHALARARRALAELRDRGPADRHPLPPRRRRPPRLRRQRPRLRRPHPVDRGRSHRCRRRPPTRPVPDAVAVRIGGRGSRSGCPGSPCSRGRAPPR